MTYYAYQRWKKKIILSLAATSLFSAITLSPILVQKVEAASITKSYSGSFSKVWQKNASTSDGARVLTYGYNKAAINEDYAHGYHATKTHYASVSNSNGSHTSGNVGKGKTAKIEVRHSGSNISYSMSY